MQYFRGSLEKEGLRRYTYSTGMSRYCRILKYCQNNDISIREFLDRSSDEYLDNHDEFETLDNDKI